MASNLNQLGQEKKQPTVRGMNNWPNVTTLNELLSSLIRIPSVNPDGDPGTGSENTGELKMAKAVGNYLEKIGAEVWYDEVEPEIGRAHV